MTQGGERVAAAELRGREGDEHPSQGRGGSRWGEPPQAGLPQRLLPPPRHKQSARLDGAVPREAPGDEGTVFVGDGTRGEEQDMVGGLILSFRASRWYSPGGPGAP